MRRPLGDVRFHQALGNIYRICNTIAWRFAQLWSRYFLELRNSIWLFTSELANRHARKVLICLLSTCANIEGGSLQNVQPKPIVELHRFSHQTGEQLRLIVISSNNNFQSLPFETLAQYNTNWRIQSSALSTGPRRFCLSLAQY